MLLSEGFIHHVRALKTGLACVPTFLLNQLIHVYSKNGLLDHAHKLFDEMRRRNVFSWNTLISAYVRSRDFTTARVLFDAASCKDLVTYNTMLSGYVGADGYEDDAFELFTEMRSMGGCLMCDDFTFTTMMSLAAKLKMGSYGRQLHSCMVKTSNDANAFAVSSLIDMYSKCGSFQEAYGVFREQNCGTDLVSKNAMLAACCREGEMEKAMELFHREPQLSNDVSWNTLISGFAQNGHEEESLKLFLQMGESGVRWNEHTFASLLSACSNLKNLRLGKEVHAWVLKNGLVGNPFIDSGVVDIYCKCGNMKHAERAHKMGKLENSYSVTSMIVGHSSQGNMDEARKLFDSLTEKNDIVWAALFSGYVKLEQSEAVFELLNEYRRRENALLNEYRRKQKAILDASIIISVLSACALQASLSPGKQIHAHVLRMGTELDEKLISALVDMYSKSGNIGYAEKIFNRAVERDSILYNIMIAGYGNHGHHEQAFKLYENMLEKEMKPDAITFLALLSACRHSGLVEMGEKYFLAMTENHNIPPETDHYACMVDLYGRANKLEKAISFMEGIPIELDGSILGSFLDACRLNGNLELATETEEKLLSIEGDNSSRYVQLANVYAYQANWFEMHRIRKSMREKKVKKHAGCSWVHVENKVHVFTSSDTSHAKANSIYAILECLTEELYSEIGVTIEMEKSSRICSRTNELQHLEQRNSWLHQDLEKIGMV